MAGSDVSGRSRPRLWTSQVGGKRASKVRLGKGRRRCHSRRSTASAKLAPLLSFARSAPHARFRGPSDHRIRGRPKAWTCRCSRPGRFVRAAGACKYGSWLRTNNVPSPRAGLFARLAWAKEPHSRADKKPQTRAWGDLECCRACLSPFPQFCQLTLRGSTRNCFIKRSESNPRGGSGASNRKRIPDATSDAACTAESICARRIGTAATEIWTLHAEPAPCGGCRHNFLSPIAFYRAASDRFSKIRYT